MTRKDLVELTDDPDLLFADGFDDAILGVAARCGQPAIVVYDREKCIDLLTGTSDMTPEQAMEHIEFNVMGSWVGPRTPAFLMKP